MSVKEKPFLDSMQDLGPIPRFLVTNSFFAGFFAMIVAALLGALALLFIGGFFGPGLELETFDTIRGGAIAGVSIGFAALVFLAISAFFQRSEAAARAYYILGALLGALVLFGADLMFTKNIRTLLETI